MDLEHLISTAWDQRDTLTPQSSGEAVQAVQTVMARLDEGSLRVAEKLNGIWHVHQWVKKAILLSFRIQENQSVYGYPYAFDKVPLKFEHFCEQDFAATGVRIVPGAVVRHSAHVAPGSVLMPSFINVGARVGEGTMIDTWATVGSCAQVGRHCHISGGVGLGGVLEPLQANPVIIEDNVFIGARSEVVEGVIVEEGAVLGMGVFIGASTPIVDRVSGEVTYGRVPAYAVVLSGSMPGKPLENGAPGPHLNCAVIVKRVDEKTRSKTALNELLRP
ncbi:MAG: 2,3,4,5-tetrahydropyridine-2,6-dicarboxylate N-succinyltransferase [Holosporales bacterium]